MTHVSTHKRRMVLALTLLLTLAATAYVWINDLPFPEDTMQVVEAAEYVGPKATVMPQEPGTPALKARELSEVASDIFAVKKMPEPEQKNPIVQQSAAPVFVSAPASSLPSAPLPPSAPSLPFTYLGKLGEDGRYTVFLASRGKNYAVKSGDMVAQVYRVVEIRPPLLTMIYLPMDIRQTMHIGEIN